MNATPSNLFRFKGWKLFHESFRNFGMSNLRFHLSSYAMMVKWLCSVFGVVPSIGKYRFKRGIEVFRSVKRKVLSVKFSRLVIPYRFNLFTKVFRSINTKKTREECFINKLNIIYIKLGKKWITLHLRQWTCIRGGKLIRNLSHKRPPTLT